MDKYYFTKDGYPFDPTIATGLPPILYPINGEGRCSAGLRGIPDVFFEKMAENILELPEVSDTIDYLEVYCEDLSRQNEIDFFLELFLSREHGLEEIITLIMEQDISSERLNLTEEEYQDDPESLIKFMCTGLLLSTLLPLYELSNVPVSRGEIFSFDAVDKRMSDILEALAERKVVKNGTSKIHALVKRKPLVIIHDDTIIMNSGSEMKVTPLALLMAKEGCYCNPELLAELGDLPTEDLGEILITLGYTSGNNGNTKFIPYPNAIKVGIRGVYIDGVVKIFPCVYTPDGAVMGNSSLTISLDVADEIFGIKVYNPEDNWKRAPIEARGNRVPVPA